MNKKWAYLWRTVQIISLIVVCVIIIYQFINLQMSSDDIKYQQSEKFLKSYSNLAAAEATRYLANNKIKELKLLIDDLSKDPIVLDVTIYDHLGQVITQSDDVLPLTKLLNINLTVSKNSSGKIPYIAELYKQDEKIGYIRITLEEQKILSLIHDYQEKSLATLYLLLILSFSAGIIVMALFFRRLENGYLNFVKEVQKTIQQKKTQQ